MEFSILIDKQVVQQRSTTSSHENANCVSEKQSAIPLTDNVNPKLKHLIMDYLRMDWKLGHVTCGNRLLIEREESLQKFASFEVELLPCLGLLGSSKILHALIGEKMTPTR